VKRIDAEYDRISDDKSGAGHGVESQHAEIEEFSGDNGRTISARYCDNDLSAFTGERRPEYDRLMSDVSKGLIRSITVWHANRLLRNTEEAARIILVFRRNDVTLYSVTRGGAYNLELAAGRRALRDDVSAAEYESDHRGERVAIARKRQARNGDFGGGVRRYGWGVDTGRVRSVCLNPKAPATDRVYEDRPVLDMTRHNEAETAEIRRWAEDLLAGVSMNQVLLSLRVRKVKTAAESDGRIVLRNGKPTVHWGWNSSTVRGILTSPRTSGHSVYKDEIIRRDVYPAIIEDHVRLALIAMFSDPSRKTSPGNTPRWLGSLIYRCGVCDDGATVSVRKNSSGVSVYRCRGKYHCSWPAEIADRYVESVVIELIKRDDASALLPQREIPDVDVSALTAEIKALRERKKEAARNYALLRIDEEILDTIQAAADARISEIRATLESATDESPLRDFIATDDVKATWDAQDIGRQREIVRRLLVVTLHPIGRGHKADSDHIKVERNHKAA
jgi:DNA invertase Pin-like site-specific DNA recombinase